MSTDLFDVTVLNRGNDWVDFLIRVAYLDAGHIPASGCFALQLILEKAYEFDSNYDRVPASPIGELVAYEKSYQPDDVIHFVDEYVKSVRVYQAANTGHDEDYARATVDEMVRALGIKEDTEEWDDAWDAAWGAWSARPDGRPRAILRVEVTDPRWVAHLEPGTSHGTTSFDHWGPYVQEDCADEPEQLADAIVPWALVDFPLATVPRGERDMEHDMIRELALAGEALEGARLEEAAHAHAAFLESGGGGGMWQILSVSGLPLCVYMSPEEPGGAQLVLRLKCVAPGAQLDGHNLEWADFSGSVCDGVSFKHAMLCHSMAMDAFFDGADFSGASLREVDFSGSSLKGCRFAGADLRGADFEHTDCTGADFRGALLEGSRFPGAILEDVRR